MKCSHCPSLGSCNGEETPRLCELVNKDHPDYQSSYLLALGGQADCDKVGESIREQQANISQYKSCLAWEKRTDCGCGVNWCKKKQATTIHQECVDCVKAGNDVRTSE